MREIACPICGDTEWKIIYEGTIDALKMSSGHFDPYEAHYRINRCIQCGLMYSSPILEPSQVWNGENSSGSW